ncbi:hypothetical protein BDR03DRAFT_953362 [Suillus americanus]|nr:hypothetical protein BDR03DRAFT_953362 [Suillus americanus]
MVRHVFCLPIYTACCPDGHIKAIAYRSSSIHSLVFPPTTTNMPPYYGSWHSNPVTHRNTPHHNPLVSWGTLPLWPNVRVHHSNFTNPTMFNEPWQNFAMPPSNGSRSPNIPPHLAAEYHFSPQPHGANIHHLAEHPPTYHLYVFPPHPSPLLHCKWLQEDTLQICGFQGTLEALKAHCKAHFSTGPPHARIECRWDRCDYKKRSNSKVRSMRRDCMWRHTSEVHLGMKRVT